MIKTKWGSIARILPRLFSYFSKPAGDAGPHTSAADVCLPANH